VIRLRLKRTFDRFIDAEQLSDVEVVRQSRALGIDVAVDLNGFTRGGRLGIFARRTAPIQASYLGWPGTLGARHYDYLLADRIRIPDEARGDFSEKIARLPLYLPDDPARQAREQPFTRIELGLPATGVVFCCFAGNDRLHPALFARWMRILAQVDGSVLMLYAENHAVVPHLQQAAQRHGIDARRLVFGKPLARPEHLARMRGCDLFLDTLPCNAGAAAEDALAIGLPVLTCAGKAFAGRETASLLTAADLPDLLAASPEAYEARAIELARQPHRLEELRQALLERAAAGSDTVRLTRGLEAAYVAMFERLRTGLAPDHFDAII
jgi:predicted O-linked N-acetylglucosamine transferase (SPINDLY family)